VLKARGTHNDGRPLVMLGLTHDNLARLVAREPIVVDTADVGIDDGPWICLFAGAEDEAGLAMLLANSGMRVPPEVTTYISKPGEEKVWKT
jgi:hypothetical protein